MCILKFWVSQLDRPGLLTSPPGDMTLAFSGVDLGIGPGPSKIGDLDDFQNHRMGFSWILGFPRFPKCFTPFSVPHLGSSEPWNRPMCQMLVWFVWRQAEYSGTGMVRCWAHVHPDAGDAWSDATSELLKPRVVYHSAWYLQDTVYYFDGFKGESIGETSGFSLIMWFLSSICTSFCRSQGSRRTCGHGGHRTQWLKVTRPFVPDEIQWVNHGKSTIAIINSFH